MRSRRCSGASSFNRHRERENLKQRGAAAVELGELLEQWMQDEGTRPAVLATVVGAEGHAYRKPGAAMLLYGDGGRAGTISPGCLESDLAARISALLAEGRSELIRYNMRPEEDAVWGEAVGCGGLVDVLLEPLLGAAAAALAELAGRLRRGERATLLRYRTGAEVAYEVNDGRGGAAAQFAPDLHGWAGRELLLTQRLAPRPRLLLFGAGYDAEPVVRQAQALGYRVTVVDWRPQLLAPERFPGAGLLAGQPEAALATLRVGRGDYVLVMGHQLRQDRALIEALLPLRPAYVGVIGSARRIALLFAGLPMPSFVRAPVGLDIGAEGPEEIAVSIAAELVAIRRSGGAGERYDRAERHGHFFGGGAQSEDGRAEAGSGVCGR